MATFIGYFLRGYSSGLAKAALGTVESPLTVTVTVVADRFTRHMRYGTDEQDGKRLLVMTDQVSRPFEVQLPVTDENGEELTFKSCGLKKFGQAKLTGVEAYLSSQRQSISFRAKSIKGVTSHEK